MANDKIINIVTTDMGGDYVKHGAEPVMALIPTAPAPPVAPPAPAPAPTPVPTTSTNK